MNRVAVFERRDESGWRWQWTRATRSGRWFVRCAARDGHWLTRWEEASWAPPSDARRVPPTVVTLAIAKRGRS